MDCLLLIMLWFILVVCFVYVGIVGMWFAFALHLLDSGCLYLFVF